MSGELPPYVAIPDTHPANPPPSSVSDCVCVSAGLFSYDNYRTGNEGDVGPTKGAADRNEAIDAYLSTKKGLFGDDGKVKSWEDYERSGQWASPHGH